MNITLKQTGKAKYDEASYVLAFLPENSQLIEKAEAAAAACGFALSSYHAKNLKGKKGEAVLSGGGKAAVLHLRKMKPAGTITNDYFRDYLAGFIGSLDTDEVEKLFLLAPAEEELPEVFPDAEACYRSMAEGCTLGAYQFDKYKQEKSKKKLTVYISGGSSAAVDKAVKEAQPVLDGVLFARELQNEPGNTIYPQELARRVKSTLGKNGVKITVFDEKEISSRKMGGIEAVGIGSTRPPRLIIAEYKPAKATKNTRTVALVGKGITFDSGGLSIKPADKMDEMKGDMGGAAAVAGAVLAAAKAKLPVRVLGVIAAAENMPDGKAFRPGDIITASNGKSIEVLNTDAEGRLVLADALHYVCGKKPDAVIDLATLTGSIVVALGGFTSGLFTKDDDLADGLLNAGAATNERIWRMPMWDEFAKELESDVADVKNIGGRWGGAISAAKFLEHFVDKDISWAHIDIAGPALPDATFAYNKKYMTGYGVRLLFEYLKNG